MPLFLDQRPNTAGRRAAGKTGKLEEPPRIESELALLERAADADLRLGGEVDDLARARELAGLVEEHPHLGLQALRDVLGARKGARG